MADNDALSLEDLAALRDIHNKLVDAKDPRAERMKAYLLSQMPPGREGDLGARGKQTLPYVKEADPSLADKIGQNVKSFGNVMGGFIGQAPTEMMNFLTGHPMEQTAQHEREIEAQKNAAYRRGDYSTGIGLGLAKSIPGSGDEGVAAGEAFGEGDIGGGMAHSLIALAPFFMKSAKPVLDFDTSRLRSPVTFGEPKLPPLPQVAGKFKGEGIQLHPNLKEAITYSLARQASRTPKFRSPITPLPETFPPRVPEWQKPGTTTEKTKRAVTDFVPQEGPMGMDAEGNLRPGDLPSGRRPGPAPVPPVVFNEPRVSLPEQYGSEASPRVVPTFEPIPGELPSGRVPGQPITITPPPPRVSVSQQAGTQTTPRAVPEFSGAQGVTLPSGRKPGTGIPKPPGLPEPPTQAAIDAEIAKGKAAEAAHKAAAEKAAAEKAAADAKNRHMQVPLKEGSDPKYARYGAERARELAEAAEKKDSAVADHLRKNKITMKEARELSKEAQAKYIKDAGYRVRGPIRWDDILEKLEQKWK